MPLRTEI